jgi:hypothetical protein
MNIWISIQNTLYKLALNKNIIIKLILDYFMILLLYLDKFENKKFDNIVYQSPLKIILR